MDCCSLEAGGTRMLLHFLVSVKWVSHLWTVPIAMNEFMSEGAWDTKWVYKRRKGSKNGGLLYCGNKSEGDRKEMMMIWFGEGVDGFLLLIASLDFIWTVVWHVIQQGFPLSCSSSRKEVEVAIFFFPV